MWKSRTITLGDERSLHALQGGEGPDLVLIHGALATHQDWLVGPAGALAGDYRVTIIDRPGHGLSRRPRFAGAPRDQARQIVSGLDALGVEKAVLVGHSFGGLTSLAMAERHPERVVGMVLVAPLAFPEPRLVEHLLLAPRSVPVAGPFLSDFAELTGFDRALLHFAQKMMFAPEPIPLHWRESFPYDQVLDAAAMVAEGEDAAAILPMAPTSIFPVPAIPHPARILTGSSDRIVRDEAQGAPLARLMPGARLTQVQGRGTCCTTAIRRWSSKPCARCSPRDDLSRLLGRW